MEETVFRNVGVKKFRRRGIASPPIPPKKEYNIYNTAKPWNRGLLTCLYIAFGAYLWGYVCCYVYQCTLSRSAYVLLKFIGDTSDCDALWCKVSTPPPLTSPLTPLKERFWPLMFSMFLQYWWSATNIFLSSYQRISHLLCLQIHHLSHWPSPRNISRHTLRIF